MIHISNDIYLGTLLEGIPYKLRYLVNRPKNFYRVMEDSIVLHNYEGWHELSPNLTTFALQNLFLHDISHAVLYHLRDENKKLFKNDFGLSWKHVKKIEGDHSHFKHEQERLDEYTIITIHDVLARSIKKKAPLTRDRAQRSNYIVSGYVWHTADTHTQKGEHRKNVLKHKKNEVYSAVDFVYDHGLDTIRDTARSLVKYLKDNM
jgi:hypothetical protein